jgi:hypothetical protein
LSIDRGDGRPIPRRLAPKSVALPGQPVSQSKEPVVPFGDILVLAVILMPFIATLMLLRSEPLRLEGLAGPAVR